MVASRGTPRRQAPALSNNKMKAQITAMTSALKKHLGTRIPSDFKDFLSAPASRNAKVKALQRMTDALNRHQDELARTTELCKTLETGRASPNLEAAASVAAKELEDLNNIFIAIWRRVKGGRAAFGELEPFKSWVLLYGGEDGDKRDPTDESDANEDQSSKKVADEGGDDDDDDEEEEEEDNEEDNEDSSDGDSALAPALKAARRERGGAARNQGAAAAVLQSLVAVIDQHSRQMAKETVREARASTGGRKALGPYGEPADDEGFSLACGAGIADPSVWKENGITLHVSNMVTVGRILKVDKSHNGMTSLSGGDPDLARTIRNAFTLGLAPVASSELRNLIRVYQGTEWGEIVQDPVLCARFKAITSDRVLAPVTQEILSLLGRQMWPQYEPVFESPEGKRYALWVEMVALYLVGRDTLWHPKMCIHGYRALLDSTAHQTLQARREKLTPTEKSWVTERMSRTWREGGLTKLLQGMQEEEMAGEDLVHVRTVIEAGQHGSADDRFSRPASKYAVRYNIANEMRGLGSGRGVANALPPTLGMVGLAPTLSEVTGQAAPGSNAAPNNIFDADSQRSLLELVTLLRSASQISGALPYSGPVHGHGQNGGRAVRGGRGRGRGQGRAQGQGGRGGHYGGGGPVPIPANAGGDPYSGQLAPLFGGNGGSNHWKIGGDRDVRQRCWKCGRKTDHVYRYCDNPPHPQWKENEPLHMIRLLATGGTTCP